MVFSLGIDLGTTNSCLYYVDHKSSKIKHLSIPQLVSKGVFKSKRTLPSFCLLTRDSDWQSGALKMPWKRTCNEPIVGSFAKKEGSRTPSRLVFSAKSWLSHAGACRRDRILPLDSDPTTGKMSPVEASACYLSHLKKTWEQAYGEHEEYAIERQDVIPASFDEVARTLTAEAAQKAGFTTLTFLEEPQAALYSWIASHEANWQSYFTVGQWILVCDIGGGTCDFSLVRVVEIDGCLSLERLAVGPHLLLGGDNMDHALAHYLLERFTPSLQHNQWHRLVHEARAAKELILNGESDCCQITIEGCGSHFVGGSQSVSLTSDDVQAVLLDGFFGLYSLEEANRSFKSKGIAQGGLPYENEPSITKHLARFLSRAGDRIFPDFVLFNGGVMKASIFRERILENLGRWFPNKNISELVNDHYDDAVAMGAAYYGKVRKNNGTRISGGVPRAFYLACGIAEEEKAITVLKRGAEEGTVYQTPLSLSVVANQAVSFYLFHSHTRLGDAVGDIVSIDEEQMQSLPPIQTVLSMGKGKTQEVSVALEITMTEIGTINLELIAQQTPHRWQLEFQINDSRGNENALSVLDKRLSDLTVDRVCSEQAKAYLKNYYCGGGSVDVKRGLSELQNIIGIEKELWPPSVLRALADSLLEVSSYRNRSPMMLAKWWNLIGYCLRPGFGYPLDDMRIKRIWKLILEEIKKGQNKETLLQLWICIRRIAGGLNRGQQCQLASLLMGDLLDKRGRIPTIKNRTEKYFFTEKVRAFASMELIDKKKKASVAYAISELQSPSSAEIWALGRLSARRLQCGSIDSVISADHCYKCLEKIMRSKSANELHHFSFALQTLLQDSGQKSLTIRDQALKRYPELNEYLTEKEEDGPSEEALFGEKLPLGLKLLEQ